MSDLTVAAVECMLADWGRWARYSGLGKLWYSPSSAEQKIPGKIHPPENPDAELIDKHVATLDQYQQKLLILHYVGDGFGPCLTINGIASYMKWDRRKVKTEINLAIGIVCGMLRGRVAA